MSLQRWLSSIGASRGVAAGVVVLAVGGLVLLRAEPRPVAFRQRAPAVAEIREDSWNGSLSLSQTAVLHGVEQPFFLELRVAAQARGVTRHTSLTLRIPPGARFLDIVGAEARQRGREVELWLGPLLAGEERRVVVALEAALSDGEEIAFSALLHLTSLGTTPLTRELGPLFVRGTKDVHAVQESRQSALLASALGAFTSSGWEPQRPRVSPDESPQVGSFQRPNGARCPYECAF